MRAAPARQRSDELLRLLLEAGVDFVVVGGLAAVAHGSQQLTDDLDLVTRMTEANWQKLLDTLGPLDARHVLRRDLALADATAEQLAGFRFVLLETALGRIDLMARVEPIGSIDDVDHVPLELFSGVTVPVISLDHLIEAKANLDRPKDRLVEKELRAIRELRE